MSERNQFVELIRDTAEVSGVATDGSGDLTVTFDGLREIDSPADVEVYHTGGYVLNVQSVSGNQATVRVFESAGSNGALSPVTGTDPGGTTYATAYGQ